MHINKIWRNALWFSFGITVVTFLYSSLYYGTWAFSKFQEIFAVAAVIVLAPSLALSGIAHFWDWGDKYIIYRKSLGLLGFYLGLLHVGMSIIRSGVAVDAFRLESWHSVSIVAGYGAVVLFGLMPAFSNPATIRRIGGGAVRRALRYLGYAAYVLVLWHIALIFWNRWALWLAADDRGLPAPSLVAFELGVAVLVLRVALFVATVKKPA